MLATLSMLATTTHRTEVSGIESTVTPTQSPTMSPASPVVFGGRHFLFRTYHYLTVPMQPAASSSMAVTSLQFCSFPWQSRRPSFIDEAPSLSQSPPQPIQRSWAAWAEYWRIRPPLLASYWLFHLTFFWCSALDNNFSFWAALFWLQS